ncbi:MAG: helix-turn-helix domain-containing protein [Promethearchaeota archaeon]
MAKEAQILKLLLDEIPRTVTEISERVEISKTYCFELLKTMAGSGAIHFRKSGGTWIAWRKSIIVNTTENILKRSNEE